MADQELRQAERAYRQESSAENAEHLLTQKNRSGQTCRKIYVVAEHYYEYDDQSFTASNDGLARKLEAFVSKENAEKFLKEENRSMFLGICGLTNGQGSGLRSWAESHTLFPDDLPTDVTTFLKDIGIDFEELVINQGSLSDNMENFGILILEARKKDQIPDDVLDQIIEASGLLYNEIIEVKLQDGICGGIRG